MTATAENPLLEGLDLARRPDPCVLVIFGASGDLTRRKLFPALYALAVRNMLPERFGVVGAARTPMSDDEFRSQMEDAIREHARDDFDTDVWKRIADATRYAPLEFGDDAAEDQMLRSLNELDEQRGTEGNRVYYLAVPPDAIETLIEEIGERRATQGWTRLIVEKPFGTDLASARALNRHIRRWFREDEVFRIDHYLGKDTVQNLLALRFANGIFEPIWNRNYVNHVEITVAESIGIEGRAAFYEQAGAIRDVFQNHLLQLVSLTAMEPPIDFDATAIRNEKVKVLRALETRRVVRGQYERGHVEGDEVPAYREEDGVAPDSRTETYVAAHLQIDNWRWAGTPFFVRVGKRLPRRETTIAVHFQRAPHALFGEGDGLRPNVLAVHVQPDEGVSLGIAAKVPGPRMAVRTVNMDFLYGGSFREELPEAYERLIHDAMRGDAMLFMRADEVLEQWRIVDEIVARADGDPERYAAGTWGPEAAKDLVAWRRH